MPAIKKIYFNSVNLIDNFKHKRDLKGIMLLADLGKNNFGIEGFKALIEAFGGPVKNKNIVFNHMHLGIGECAVVAEMVKDRADPFALCLNNCNIDDEKLGMLASAYLNNPSFQNTF